MRVMSYNILDGGQTLGGRLDTVIDVVRHAAPDVLALNECNGFANDGHRMLHRLEATWGMRGTLAEARSGFHVAIFVRDMRVIESHPMLDWFHHGALRLVVQHGRRRVTLISAHLCPFSSQARVREAQYLASFVREKHAIVLGDFNGVSRHDVSRIDFAGMLPYRRSRQLLPGTDEVDTRAVAVLESAGLVDLWHQAHPHRHGATVPTPLVDKTAEPVLRLDYLFGTPSIAKALRNMQVIRDERTRVASDHYPLLAELNF